MKLFRRLQWALRRLEVPIDSAALVLEVGSGGNPYPRANVLLDAYVDTHERFWAPLVSDRPTVLAFGENLPFKDKTFDYVIAAHVLEHTPHPEQFLAELQRVAHAGYIETPDAFMERINPYRDHRLEITVRNDVLLIRKKPAWIYDEELVELYERRAKRLVSSGLIPDNPVDFHVRYFWKDKISFRVVNPEIDASWRPLVSDTPLSPKQGNSIKGNLRLALLGAIRWLFSQGRRNARIDLVPHLLCTRCHSGNLSESSNRSVVCGSCGAHYKKYRGVFYMQGNGAISV